MKNKRASHRAAKPVLAMLDIRRRRVLQGMLGGGLLAVTGLDVSAQTRGPLYGLPRHALVIGNSQYKEAPLRNPANDAAAIAGALKRTGFQVAQSLDASRAAMLEAIQSFGSRLQQQGAVGLFFFAGHGVQLAWRNYLIPVDAVIDNPDDVRARAVELNALLQALTRAKNPMNVIILDACRDNPFGSRVTTGQKGLSQFDAPPGSLLAYATAPGNVAGDGEGVHGLYTENLLREMQVPDAKIEDVFKRVRLHVRRRTHGQQIPWESTSLEEDFYFLPPRTPEEIALERERQQERESREKQRAAEEAERKRKEEQALLEAKRAAEEAERKRQQELAALEQRRIAEEAERNRKRELALKEAQRVAEAAERKRREEQALLEARRAEEEAERQYQQELALREKQLADAEAERKRKEEQALREARLAQEEAERKYQQELALREKQEAERRRTRQAAPRGKPDPALVERLFEEELAIWEEIKASKDPKPLEAYLLRYPSGRFSELAQLQLDRILAAQGEKRIAIVSAAENPFSKGSAAAGTRYIVGDSYTYRVSDLYTKVVTETYTQTITKITDTEVIYDSGMITDLLGNRLRHRDGRLFGPSQFLPLEFAVGRRWSSRFKVTTPRGEGLVDLEVRITAREAVTVPAGTFNAFRLEGNGWSNGPWGSTRVAVIRWIAPDRVRRPIATEDFRKAGTGRIVASEREELVAFRQA